METANALVQRLEVLAVENAILRAQLEDARSEIVKRDEQVAALRGDANEETYEDGGPEDA